LYNFPSDFGFGAVDYGSISFRKKGGVIFCHERNIYKQNSFAKSKKNLSEKMNILLKL
jgi:hypothetical protein